MKEEELNERDQALVENMAKCAELESSDSFVSSVMGRIANPKALVPDTAERGGSNFLWGWLPQLAGVAFALLLLWLSPSERGSGGWQEYLFSDSVEAVDREDDYLGAIAYGIEDVMEIGEGGELG